jgi:hypothetical protein
MGFWAGLGIGVVIGFFVGVVFMVIDGAYPFIQR